MPFSGPSSYLPTIDEFIGHWTDVNAALGLTPLVLSGGYALASLQTDRDALATDITNLTGAINVLEGHRTARDNSKDPMRERMRQFGAFVRGMLPDSVYVGEVPALVQTNASIGKWIVAMDDYEHMWTTINATPPAGFTPPLVLNGPYAIADFTADVTALKTTFTALVQAEQDTDRERDERDALYRDIRDRLVQYRLAVQGNFPADDRRGGLVATANWRQTPAIRVTLDSRRIMAAGGENFRKHLEFIQLTITRMAANSFLIKGWSITLVIAIIAFMSKDGRPTGAALAIVPIIAFWVLDAYYLTIERRYRQLYDRVRESDARSDEERVDYSLNIGKLGESAASWWSAFFSRTILPYYLALASVVGLVVWLGNLIIGDC